MILSNEKKNQNIIINEDELILENKPIKYLEIASNHYYEGILKLEKLKQDQKQTTCALDSYNTNCEGGHGDIGIDICNYDDLISCIHWVGLGAKFIEKSESTISNNIKARFIEFIADIRRKIPRFKNNLDQFEKIKQKFIWSFKGLNGTLSDLAILPKIDYENSLRDSTMGYIRSSALYKKSGIIFEKDFLRVSRKLGHVQNQLGIYYLAQERFTNAAKYFNYAMFNMENGKDKLNSAFVYANMGKLMRQQALKEAQLQEMQYSISEDSFFVQAINFYQNAKNFVDLYLEEEKGKLKNGENDKRKKKNYNGNRKVNTNKNINININGNKNRNSSSSSSSSSSKNNKKKNKNKNSNENKKKNLNENMNVNSLINEIVKIRNNFTLDIASTILTRATRLLSSSSNSWRWGQSPNTIKKLMNKAMEIFQKFAKTEKIAAIHFYMGKFRLKFEKKKI